MIRVVLDSNVFISALIFGGNPRQLIHLAENGLIQLYASESLRSEVERVLDMKFRWSGRRVTSVAGYLWSLTRLVEPRKPVRDCVDPDDNHILECAIEAGAHWIITGDHHLLLLHPYNEIAIVTPSKFLSRRPWEDLPEE